MKMDKVASSKNDEFYTPKYAIDPIINYLKEKGFKNVWCPFDTEKSLYVNILKSHGFNITYTHIASGENGNFFNLIKDNHFVDNFDVIVSNPPYSLKTEVLESLFDSKKPFAMLLGVVGIFESQKRFDMFKNNIFEIMYFNRRVSYFEDYNEQKPSKNPPFSSVYITSKVLPKHIVFEEINKSNLV
ncbi:MAG TPA: hypothetical protein K8V14_02520 [Staphylococcus ureilyticus]|uniref:hypothetical protein n=1 Tax=Staphylococcus ureilyticus TaxID=94138 RepID=UPI001D6C3A0C|nr:hypothetical protein [Staphylococcus ureilyticus]HJG66172.1 hypothetical protein [Staphylococcus ureilyticus]